MDVDLEQLRQPCAGSELEMKVETVCIEAGAVSGLMDILQNYQNPVFICDSNTRAAAEPFLEEEFKDYPVIELNPDGLQADNRGVRKVMKQLDYCDRGLSSVSVDVLVAIGSGTIHDLTRYAAREYDIPFVSVPTAASIDGFAADMAMLMWDGRTQVMPAAAPTWILADTDIFADAPSWLTSAGVSRVLERYQSIREWKKSDALGEHYSSEEAFELEERALKDVERSLDEIRERDRDALEKLMYALILIGITARTDRAAQ